MILPLAMVTAALAIAPASAAKSRVLPGHEVVVTTTGTTQVQANTGATVLEWLEDGMCFCTLQRRAPVRDGYRTPFGLARRVHGDFRGRSVDVVEDAGF